MYIGTSGKNTFQNGFLSKMFTQVHDIFPILSVSPKEAKESYFGDDEQDLIDCIKISIRDWENANMNFENAEDDELVDYYSYQIKAAEVKYQYLLRLIKEKGLNTDRLYLPTILNRVR